jgi:Methyltransferase domain
MSACQCGHTDSHFTRERAQADLAAYRRRGPAGTARLLLGCLRDLHPEVRTLLDVGAGVGVLHHELLDAGISSAVHLEVASAYLDAAREETRRRGHEGRVLFRLGDLVGEGAALANADLVTLDRVICCYHDLDSLIEVSTRRADRFYALSYPHDRWYVRARTRRKNHRRQRSGDPYRFFVHPVSRVRRLIAGAGFEVLRRRANLNWEVLLCKRRRTPGNGVGAVIR